MSTEVVTCTLRRENLQYLNIFNNNNRLNETEGSMPTPINAYILSSPTTVHSQPFKVRHNGIFSSSFRSTPRSLQGAILHAHLIAAMSLFLILL